MFPSSHFSRFFFSPLIVILLFSFFWNNLLTPQPLVRIVGQYIGIYGIPYNMCYVDCLRTVYCRHILNFTKKQIVVEIISRYIDFLSLSSELKLFYSWSRNRKLFHRWSLNWKLFYRWSLNWKRVLRWSLNWNFFIVGLWIKTFSSLISELKLFHRWSLNWNFFILASELKLFHRWSLNWNLFHRWPLNWNFFIVGLWIGNFLVSELETFSSLASELIWNWKLCWQTETSWAPPFKIAPQKI